MNYLIDGHNLIPKLPGLDLRLIDDEMKLVRLLQEYCRLSRNRVEVYFDNAPLGQAGRQKYSTVVAYFILQGRTADDAIRQRLVSLGKGARNWSVVSSDQQVLSEARAVHAGAIPSEQFARVLLKVIRNITEAEKPPDIVPSAEEIAAWQAEFGRRSRKSKP